MEKEYKLTTPMLCKISKIINKMGISALIMKLNVNTGNEEADQEELVKELISLIIDNLYKAEEDVIEFIAVYRNITPEEAAEEDVIEFIKELMKIDKLKSFLKLT